MSGPLTGVRVLDLTTGVAGPYATKLLADFGADVIKVEPPGGDPARMQPPFFHEQPHPEGSGRFLYLNTNKRSIVLDLDSAADRAVIRGLAARSDLVIEDQRPGRLAELGLGYADLERLRPGIVLTSITPWGQTGSPYEGYRLTDLVAQAMGGPMLWTGSAEKEPLRLGGSGDLALQQAGLTAAVATLIALYRQEVAGEGDHVDIAIYETQAGSRDRSAPYMLNHTYNGIEPKRQFKGSAVASGTRPCADGYVNINGTGTRLPNFLRMIGLADLAEAPDLRQRSRQPDFHDIVEPVYLGWLMEHGKAEAAAIAQQYHMLAAPVNAISDTVADPHFRERGAWETIEHPHTGPVTYPGRPFVMSATPRPPARRAPLLDEHRAEILASVSPVEASRETAAHPQPASRLPLAGVRVADITAVWAGPHVTQLLAEWGAEVIRVEPVTRIQPSTRWAERQSTKAMEEERGRIGMAAGGSYPDFEPGEEPWNRNSGFNSHARNKLSMACDVMTEEGRAAFLHLIATCDVFVENNVPDTIEKAGITWEVLREVRPDLVMLRMPGFGLSGPYKGWRAYGTHIEGLIGHHLLRGYKDGTPDDGGEVYTADASAGLHGAVAVLMALRHRARTGEGQQIELAQAETFFPMLAEPILDVTMNGIDPGIWGNRHRTHAPHNAYPCAGEDEWVAIDVGTDAEFRALCEVLAYAELADDPRFATAGARWEHYQELDRLIGEQTRGWDKWELFRALQGRGVAAGALQHAAERLRCPHLTARSFFEYLENDVTGGHLHPGIIWKMARTPNQLRRAPVKIGQDNEPLYLDLLGMDAAEYQRRRETGAIGERYAPRVFAAVRA